LPGKGVRDRERLWKEALRDLEYREDQPEDIGTGTGCVMSEAPSVSPAAADTVGDRRSTAIA
jgi:hypothetical protein